MQGNSNLMQSKRVIPRQLRRLARLSVVVVLSACGDPRFEKDKEKAASGRKDNGSMMEGGGARRPGFVGCRSDGYELAISTACDLPPGAKRGRELERLFRVDPDRFAKILAEIALEKNDLEVMHVLGRCCGATGSDEREMWIRRRFEGKALLTVQRGYVEGLASLSPERALCYVDK